MDMISHHALACDDILKLIFEKIAPDDMPPKHLNDQYWYLRIHDCRGERKARLRSLVNCALVCKVWCRLVLDIIWRRLDTPKHLFRLFSTYGETVLDHWICTSSVAHLQTTSRSEWERFLMYSERIRHLRLHEKSSERQDFREAFKSLASQSQHRELFPRLLTADFGMVDTGALQQLCAIMPRKLRKLDIHFTSGGREDDSNLQVLTARGGLLRSLSFDFPHLQELRITYFATMRSLIVDPSDTPFPFQGLRTLHLANILDSFEPQLWQALSALPHLDKLEASATGSGSELRGCRGFPSLTDLTLDIATWSVVALALNAITSPSLKRVEIRHERDGRFELPQHTFATAMSLLSKRYSQTLRTVKILLQIPAGGNCGVADGIFHLLAARGIESFDFTRWPMDNDEDIQVDLPDDILCNMGRSWPRLTELVMDPGLCTYPTTASVAELLSSCPALDILELEGVTVSPRSAMEYPPPQFPHGLRFLALGAFIGDSDTMAEFLDRAFRDPEIAKLCRCFQGDEDVDQEYKALKRCIGQARFLARD